MKNEADSKNKMNKGEIEKALLDNFISLQKVLTNLALKFDDLSSNISKLLQLFEISAKSFVDKNSVGETGKQPEVDKEFLKKLDSLLDQNKTISKAIMMMEERIRNRTNPAPIKEQNQFEGMFKSRALPKY